MVTPRLPIDQEIAAEFARVFDDAHAVTIGLVPNPDASLPGLHALKSGHADLALVSNTEAYDPEVTTIVPLYPTVLHIAYRGKSIQSVSDLLDDRTVYAGPPGSARGIAKGIE